MQTAVRIPGFVPHLVAAAFVALLAACGARQPAPGAPGAALAAANEAVARRYVTLLNEQQFDRLTEVLAPEFKLQLGVDALDRPQTIDVARSVFTSFPDFHLAIDDVITSGDRVVLRITNTGTHAGEFMGVAATGRKFTIGQITIFRVAGGQIVEAWEQADLAGLLQQIQASPAGSGPGGSMGSP